MSELLQRLRPRYAYAHWLRTFLTGKLRRPTAQEVLESAWVQEYAAKHATEHGASTTCGAASTNSESWLASKARLAFAADQAAAIRPAAAGTPEAATGRGSRGGQDVHAAQVLTRLALRPARPAVGLVVRLHHPLLRLTVRLAARLAFKRPPSCQTAATGHRGAGGSGAADGGGACCGSAAQRAQGHQRTSTTCVFNEALKL
jgi:hypothetical protein